MPVAEVEVEASGFGPRAFSRNLARVRHDKPLVSASFPAERAVRAHPAAPSAWYSQEGICMKVSGPTQIPPAGASPAAEVEEVGQHGDVADTGRVTHPNATERASAPGHAQGVPVADLAHDVDAGKLSPQLALEQVMDRVLERHLDANAPVALREQLRTALLDALDSDPLLAEKLAQLG